jgi:hypothetical protein
MTEYRDRTTGEIKTQGELRRDNPNMSLPKTWNTNVHDALNVDPVFAAPKPTEGIGTYQTVQRNGATQDSNGNWVQAWQIVDMFSDYTDAEGVAHSKAEQEAEYQSGIDTSAANNNKATRNRLLSETDWWAMSDRTMTAEQTAYRQTLRDITSHANWPHLEDADWPTKP